MLRRWPLEKRWPVAAARLAAHHLRRAGTRAGAQDRARDLTLARAVGRPPLLPPGWIVFAVFSLNPVWWLLGFGDFVWPLAAHPAVVWILLRREHPRAADGRAVRRSTSSGRCVTIVRLDRATRLLSFGFRYSAYLTALGPGHLRVQRAPGHPRPSSSVGSRGSGWPPSSVATSASSSPTPRHRPRSPACCCPTRSPATTSSATWCDPASRRCRTCSASPCRARRRCSRSPTSGAATSGLLTPFFVASFLYSTELRERRVRRDHAGRRPAADDHLGQPWPVDQRHADLRHRRASAASARAAPFALKLLVGAIVAGRAAHPRHAARARSSAGRLERLGRVHACGHLRRGVGGRASRFAAARLGRTATVGQPVLAVDRHARPLLARDVLARLRRAGAVRGVGDAHRCSARCAAAIRCRSCWPASSSSVGCRCSSTTCCRRRSRSS